MRIAWFVVGFAVLALSVNARPRVPACKNCFKVLNTDIKNAAKKSMTAVAQAGMDLTQMRIQFADQQFNLEANLKKAKEMSENIKSKIQNKIKEIMKNFEKMTQDTKEKLAEVAAASDALGELEKKVGTKEVKDKAKKIRNDMAKGQQAKSNLAKQVLNENGVIAKLDAAKILAKDKVLKAAKALDKKKATVRDDIARLESDMSSAEDQLKNEEDQEMESEREARSKIQEAVKHNKAAINKAKLFLLSVEKGIEKFNNDIKEVPLS
ncbi:myosin heavy chain, cardiac muscle isoform [Exaiptasia diaphana]|uniref:Uncharacterized protein n=1 Tax=Exaiptasia diaphana TaxID=2652724 RepID=A0A913WQU2_EXADI|nr:myosin heavy chain, cardiac muscle isoform [Exaiptasia diaphana]KXJ18715.1 hypothetical protein AC249_AIPGENE25538 [Exaiptasia diaphana]